MPKPGDEYQEIVGLIREALDPDATVSIGQWVEGPDCERDLDVEVRGTVGGERHFALLECKDWNRKVGIGVVDAFESKRHDLGADSASIYSNSGFTRPALRKAKRVGIQLFSALRAGDDRIRYVRCREVVATMRSVKNYQIGLSNKSGEPTVLPDNWTPLDIEYAGLPLVNFFRDESLEILRQEKVPNRFAITYVFGSPICFEIKGSAVEISALRLTMECRQTYVSQMVRENVTLGHYDFLNDKVWIPNNETLIVGNFDNSKWTEIDTAKFKVESRDLQPNTMQFGLNLFNPIKGVDGLGTPQLSSLIKERMINALDK